MNGILKIVLLAFALSLTGGLIMQAIPGQQVAFSFLLGILCGLGAVVYGAHKGWLWP